MRTFKIGTAIAGALVVLGVTAAGCVADRPARNGVFNENQYVRKDFLIQGVDTNGSGAGTGDPGWLVRGTVTEVSTPNLLGNGLSIWSGLSSDINLVRFRVTSDKLQMLDVLQYGNPINTVGNNFVVSPNNTGVTQNVINAWPVSNVDLKYQVNLDGETTNQYQENQELDWQVRQWVKIQFDKNDMSDFAPLGPQITQMLSNCADGGDASTTLVDGSFNIEGADDDDPSNDYMEFTVQVTVPLLLNNNDCLTAYGSEALAAQELVGFRNDVTVNLKYSFKRAAAAANGQNGTYQPWTLAEKDPIHRKYWPIDYVAYSFDYNTNLVAANDYIVRFDPTKPIVWYFDQNFPAVYKNYFVNPSNPADPTTIMGATNAILTKAHEVNPTTTAQVSFKEYNDGGVVRNYGDIRYNFLRWTSDQFVQTSGMLGVTMNGFDPRTGENINTNIMYNDYPTLDIVQRIDAFLVTVGASQGLGTTWTDPGACTVGQTLPIVTDTVLSNHNASSTLYQKMQQYLNLNAPIPGDPASGTSSQNNHLGPQDFAALFNETDPDFLNAYLTLAPYEVFRDPSTNPYVTAEGQGGVRGPADMWADIQNETVFQAAAATLNTGSTPFAPAATAGGTGNFVALANGMRSVTQGHVQYQYDQMNQFPHMKLDAPGTFGFEGAMERDSRMCVCNSTDISILGSTSGYGKCAQGTPGVWETKEQWQQRIINRSWAQTLWHEFGHGMGMDHNYMGSIDQPNFTAQRDANGNVLCDVGTSIVAGSPNSGKTCPNGHTLYNMMTSTVMEYLAEPNNYNFVPGWGYYDQGHIAWLYGNTGNTNGAAGGVITAPATSQCMVATDCGAANVFGTPFTCQIPVTTSPVGTTPATGPGVCVPTTSRSGQASPSFPYNDPYGFCVANSVDCPSSGPPITVAGTTYFERQFQLCNDADVKYSPLCRQWDVGITPSQILANDIDQYEWEYQYRNYRNWHKTWNLSGYANEVSRTITDLRRFMSVWAFDWAPGNLQNDFIRIGVFPPVGSDGQPMPTGNGSLGYTQSDYYAQLQQKFLTEMSKQGQMMAAFDEALINQSAGERPYATVYDKFYGDVTQQGIVLDKYYAMQGFVGLWLSDNYDQNEAGSYISSWGSFDGYDVSYQSVAETAVRAMIGPQYTNLGYPYFIPTAVALFAQDTHSPSFIGGGGRIETKEWIGGWTFGGVGTEDGQQELINFFKTVALNSCAANSDTCLANCTIEAGFAGCLYDVTNPDQVAQNPSTLAFTGPDGLNYVYAYLPTRNQYVLAREDRNIVTWTLINEYNSDVIGVHDGSDSAYGLEYPIEYTIDAYNMYEFGSLTNDQQSSAGDAGAGGS